MTIHTHMATCIRYENTNMNATYNLNCIRISFNHVLQSVVHECRVHSFYLYLICQFPHAVTTIRSKASLPIMRLTNIKLYGAMYQKYYFIVAFTLKLTAIKNELILPSGFNQYI